MKNKTWIIIQREFNVRIKKKSFILLTILMPFLMAALVFVPAFLAQVSSDDVQRVAIVDLTGKYAPSFQKTEKLQFDILNETRSMEELHKEFQEENNPYNAVVYISSDLTRSKDGAATIYSRKEVTPEIERYVNQKLSEKIRNDRLAGYNIANVEEIISDANVDFSVKTMRWDKEGNEKLSSSAIAGVVGLVLALFIYMFILSYGGMVMQGVTEEKTNRIMEIMVSSVKPYQLMFGKIVGIAFVGLFQFLVWMLMLISIITISGSVFGLATATDPTAMVNIPTELPQNAGAEFLQILQGMNIAQMAILFILYFIGGYLLFASVFAAIGASINEQQDAQQFMMPMMIIFVFALYAGMFSIENPDGPLAFWCSFIPFTSPIVMMVRIPFDIPIWQTLLSLALLYGTSAAIVWLSAKIYRVGILMYGKKPTLKEMLRWVKYN